ncbi:uncharacterized protein LOC144132746 isoform X2 [Amblyomma americanum]
MWGKRPPSRKPPWFSHRQLCRKPAAALLPSGQRCGPGRKPTPSKLGGRQYFKAVTTKMKEIQLKQEVHHMAIADLDEAGYQWADKRAHHNALERRRRDHIKFSFTSLRDAVPSLQGEKPPPWPSGYGAWLLARKARVRSRPRRSNFDAGEILEAHVLCDVSAR